MDKRLEKYNQEIKDWKEDKLGMDFVPVSQPTEARIKSKLGLKMVSIRLPEEIIDSLKKLAEQEFTNYQPYVRKILIDYVKEHQKD